MLFEQMFERVAMGQHPQRVRLSRAVAMTAMDGLGAPLRFTWRERRYVVRTVLLNWCESAAWWRAGSHNVSIWRVEAQRETTQLDHNNADVFRRPHVGVYDLAYANERWYMQRVMD